MKKETARFWWGFGVGLVVCGVLAAVVPWVVAASGAVDVSADGGRGALEHFLHYTADRSIDARAAEATNPLDVKDPAVIAQGLAHYKENCLVCHGAPGMEESEVSKGMNPHPPFLVKAGEHAPDGKLFWVISHGIRMTGMPAFGPTHTEKERWAIVAFLRELPHLSDAEKAKLKAGTEEEAHHHEASGEHTAGG